MNTGCKQCDKAQKKTGNNIEMCPKCYLKYLKWVADAAQNDYLEELKTQSMKGNK